MDKYLSRSGAIAGLRIETVPLPVMIMSPDALRPQASAACGDTGSGIDQGLSRLSYRAEFKRIQEEEGNIW